jgi:hypothetical protein
MTEVLRATRSTGHRCEQVTGFEFLTPVMVEYWTDERWSWVWCKELEILVGGDNPGIAELEFYRELIQRKLDSVKPNGKCMEDEMVGKLRRVL